MAAAEAEALILTVIQELESCQIENTDGYSVEFIKDHIQGLTDELEMILVFLRDKKLVEGRCRLNYFISDLVELLVDITQVDKDHPHRYQYFRSCTNDLKMLMLQSGDGVLRSEDDFSEGDEQDVVGLEKGEKLLLNTSILNEKQGLSTSLITGMIGVGKTALARKLYNHPSVIQRFDRRAWVRVSRVLSQKEILMKLIQEVVGIEELRRDSLLEKMELADNETLQKMLHRCLEGTRYFIVLDDLHLKMRLESIFKGLPNEEKGSRVVLISRLQNIPANYEFTHEVKPLDSDKSWRLFLKTILSGNKFTSEQKFPKHLEGNAKDILRKCGGVPLAIKDVAEQVAEKRLLGSEWEESLESIDMGSTLKLFESIYDNLDPESKLGFLYLSFFKANISVRIEKMKQVLVAGGIISKSDYIELYLWYLLNESIIEVKDSRNCNDIKRFRINVMLHMLSIQKAEEEISFQVLRKDSSSQPSEKPRHRAIDCSREKFDYSTNQDKHLDSLFFHGGGYFNDSPSYWKSLERLKILDFEDFGLKNLPESIGTLMELRYLGLRNNYLEKLPRSLRCLRNLEVLDIALNFMMELPDILPEIISLRHLYMSDVICRNPLKMETLQNLETLAYISVDDWIHELLGIEMMTSLKKLGMEGLDGNADARKIFASLASLKDLHSLILKGFRFKSLPYLDDLGLLHSIRYLKLDGLVTRLPSADNFPPNIDHLALVNTRLDEDPMPILEKLPKLEVLILHNAYTGQQMVIFPDGFPKLKALYIDELWNLRNLHIREGALLLLEKIEINNCPYMETLPEELESMTQLVSLTMVTTRNIAAKIKIKSSSLISIRVGPRSSP